MRIDATEAYLNHICWAINEGLEPVAEISKNVRSIAESAEEQSTGISEISTSINQLDSATQQNAAMVEETTASSLTLRQEAEAMSKAAAQFKIRGESREAADRPGIDPVVGSTDDLGLAEAS